MKFTLDSGGRRSASHTSGLPSTRRDRVGRTPSSPFQNALCKSSVPSCLVEVVARSKRKPSTCISVTQYRRESMMSPSAAGCPTFRLLPVVSK